MNFGKRLKDIRAKHNLTQQQLSEITGVSRATIAGYETKNKQPDFTVLYRLSEYFNVTIDYLLNNDTQIITLPDNCIIFTNTKGVDETISLSPEQKKRLIALLKAGFPELLDKSTLEKIEQE